MKEIPIDFPDLKLLELSIFPDERGFFVERFRSETWSKFPFSKPLIQENHSRSKPRVLRGLHFQTNPPQAKLVSVVRGKIFDVAVDLRRDSPQYGKWFGVELSGENGRMLWIPYGFAHGFCVMGDEPADVVYKVDGTYNPKTEGGIHWNSKDLGITWPVKDPIVSPKDQALGDLQNTFL